VIGAPAVWDDAEADTAPSSPIIVGVIDTGKTAHPDLDGQWIGGYDFIGASSMYNPLFMRYENADGFNASVDEMQNTLNQQAKSVEEAYTKASDYSSIAKNTFEKLFGETGDLTRASTISEQINVLPEDNQRMYEFATSFGLRPEDALEFAPDVSKMSIVAQQTFYDSLAENPDTANAFNTAQQINSLDKTQQDSFFNAKIQGLDTAQAFDVVSNVGGLSKEQQDTYIDTV
jgi:hypothetical protein